MQSLKLGNHYCRITAILLSITLLLTVSGNIYGQQPANKQVAINDHNEPELKENAGASGSTGKPSDASERERLLLERIDQLEKRLGEVDQLKKRITELENRASEKQAVETKSASDVKPVAAVEPISVGLPISAKPVQEPQNLEKTKPIEEKAPKVPFAFADFTWMNGQNRQKSSTLNFPDQHISLNMYLDTYYDYSFNKPRDNTIVGSSTIGRNGEFQINLASLEISMNYKNVFSNIAFQAGSQLNVIQDLDASVLRGRDLSTNNLKYIREATAGYHIDKWYGVNVEAGIFPSYIGLESYLTAENWSYNRSLVCDYTPFYFQGMRVQIFPTEKIKIEPWFMNGFQTYGKFNNQNSEGLSLYYRPYEDLGFVANFYYGSDVPGDPKIHRFHHDDSILKRYYNKPESRGISKMAFSMNNHIGFQHGDGVSRTKAYMAGTSIANRIWFDQDRFAFTVRGEYISNPTRYLAPPPTANGFPTTLVNGDNGYSNNIRGVTTTFDFMPTDFMAFRIEDLYRVSNEPFFAGPGGTTPPPGFQGTFVPDLRKSEHRITAAINFRF
jgi:hypothetical protein